MKKLLIGVLTLFSISSFAADDFSEKDIKEITEATKVYITSLYNKMANSCPQNRKVVDGRVNLNRWIYDDSDPNSTMITVGKLTYRCEDSTEWHDGELCEFTKDSIGVWQVEYCDS